MMKKRRLFVCLLLAVLLLVGCGDRTVEKPPAEGEFALTFLTIGKGDSFLLTAPEGAHYLVDTGKAQDFQQIARLLRVKGVDHLDGIFLSHGHKDHAGCLEPLLNTLPVDRVYISQKDHVSYTEIDPRTIVPKFPNVELVELEGGETLDLGGAQAEVWIPSRVYSENANDNSMVLRVTHGENVFLLMGDTELEEESELMHAGFPLKADVLKLGHHGETDATSPAFLDKVSPSMGLITGNAEENPDSVNPTISGYLSKRGIQSYYSEGDNLDIRSDGAALTVEPVPDKAPEPTLRLSFEEVDRKQDVVTIRNDGKETASLQGCVLISTRGDEIYHFPAETVLEPGQTLTVVSQDSPVKGDLVWPVDSVWKKRDDTALLYDGNMNLLAENSAAD